MTITINQTPLCKSQQLQKHLEKTKGLQWNHFTPLLVLTGMPVLQKRSSVKQYHFLQFCCKCCKYIVRNAHKQHLATKDTVRLCDQRVSGDPSWRRPQQPDPGPVHGTSPGASQLRGARAAGLHEAQTGLDQLWVGYEKQITSILLTDLPIWSSEVAFLIVYFESHMVRRWKCIEKGGLDYKQEMSW